MKLRIYTPEETDDLINRFAVIAEYMYEIHEKAYELLMLKHMDYMHNFRPSLFKWKFMDFAKFVNNLSHYDHAYFYNHEVPSYCTSLFDNTLLNKSAKFFRGNSYGTGYYSGHFTKYGVDAFTKEEIQLLSRASSLISSFAYNYKLEKKYNTLVKYAHRPFEFDEDDIWWLESVDSFYNEALKWNSN